MKKTIALIVLALTELAAIASFSPSAQAYIPSLDPLCGQGYRRDSYGKGLDAAFTAQLDRPQLNDEACFQHGYQAGLELNTRRIQNCVTDFAKGKKMGFAGRTVSGDLTECFQAGYESGRALLGIGARESNARLVGERCLNAYARGKSDSDRCLAQNSPEFLGTSPIGVCYMTGYLDADMLRHNPHNGAPRICE
jgi:hypothetical protein